MDFFELCMRCEGGTDAKVGFMHSFVGGWLALDRLGSKLMKLVRGEVQKIGRSRY